MKTKGTINRRIISGKEYFYHQYLEDGKQVSKTISKDEAYEIASKIYYDGKSYDDLINHQFNMEVHFGFSLFKLSEPSSIYKKRYCYEHISNFMSDQRVFGKALVLYGLRRTGKTTLMFQYINSLSFKEFIKAAYIKCDSKKNIHQLFDDLKYLTNNGFKYIFIDEVTLLADFIALSATLSDIYGLKAKVVLSGADSLGFYIAGLDELYDRQVMIHTTYISYKEFFV